MLRFAFLPFVALVACQSDGADDVEPPACDGCNLGTEADTDGGTFHVTYSVTPDPIVVGEDFDVRVIVYDAADMSTMMSDATVDVDAWMPLHGHGMSVTPTITPNGDGTFVASGMQFSMTGHWEVTVEVTHGEVTEQVVFDIVAG
jgi:hypothetical protein